MAKTERRVYLRLLAANPQAHVCSVRVSEETHPQHIPAIVCEEPACYNNPLRTSDLMCVVFIWINIAKFTWCSHVQIMLSKLFQKRKKRKAQYCISIATHRVLKRRTQGQWLPEGERSDADKTCKRLSINTQFKPAMFEVYIFWPKLSW